MFNFQIDFWTIWGLMAQGFFFMRFVLQWYLSEKEGKITFPRIFWILSLVGSIMLIFYSLSRKDIVFLISGTLQIIIFSRSFMISRKERHSDL